MFGNVTIYLANDRMCNGQKDCPDGSDEDDGCGVFSSCVHAGLLMCNCVCEKDVNTCCIHVHSYMCTFVYVCVFVHVIMNIQCMLVCIGCMLVHQHGHDVSMLHTCMYMCICMHSCNS